MNISIGLGILFLIIFVCIVMSAYLVWTFQSSTIRRSKRSRSNAKEQQIARDEVARFYGTNQPTSPYFRISIGKSSGSHLETVKLIDRMQGPKTGVVCGIQIPPLHTTVACTIQPDLEAVAQKKRLTRALSDCHNIRPNILRSDRWSHINILPKLSEPNFGRNLTLTRGGSLFCSRLVHSSQDSMTSAHRRKSSMDKIIDPMLRMFTTSPSRGQYCQEGNWTNVSPNLEGSGQICFSLCYTCTFSLLNVTINRLTGVTYLSKTESTLPSQVTNNFIVGLRIRQRTNRPKSDVSGMAHKTFFTQPILTSHNPTFDQSFSFKINLADLDETELVFTVLTSTMRDKHPFDGDRRRTRSTVSLYYPVKKLASEEMRCIGVAFFKLNRHELINCGEKLQNVWQVLRKLPELEDVRHLEMKDGQSSPKAKFIESEKELDEIEGRSSFQKETSSSNSDCSSQSVNEISLTMIYRKSSSMLEIQLNEVRGNKIRKSDVRLFIRATLCSGSKHIASSQSNYTKISKSDKTNSPTHKLTSPEDFCFANAFRPRGESISFLIDMLDLVSTQSYGVVLYLYARNRIGLTRRLGKCYFGARNFTDASESQHWSRLVKAVQTIQSDPHVDETDPISYWHIMMN